MEKHYQIKGASPIVPMNANGLLKEQPYGIEVMHHYRIRSFVEITLRVKHVVSLWD